MKRSKKSCIAGISAISLAVALVSPVSAIVGKMTMNADYNDIKLSLNGQTFTPTDANGNYVEPFAVNGSTYLPVRAVGEALGVQVGWDGKTSTVTLTQDTDKNDVNDDIIYALSIYHYLFELGDKQDNFLLCLSRTYEATKLHDPDRMANWKEHCDVAFESSQSYMEDLIDYCVTDELLSTWNLFLNAQSAAVDASNALWKFYATNSDTDWDAYMDKYFDAIDMVDAAKEAALDAFNATLENWK